MARVTSLVELQAIHWMVEEDFLLRRFLVWGVVAFFICVDFCGGA